MTIHDTAAPVPFAGIQSPGAPGRALPGALAATGAVLLALGAVLGPVMMFDPSPYSVKSGESAHLVHYALWAGCLIVLSQVYPLLGGGSSGAGMVSARAGVAAGAGVALDACTRFALAFYNPFLASHAPDLLDTAPDAVLLVPLLSAGVAAMSGTVWLAVSGWRRGTFPWPAAVLLLIGAVTIPAIGPLSNVAVGGALLWIGLSVLRRRGRA
ncbi:hypothetical protein TESS_TESS_00525 [Tessaracoccus sp. O5.2]|uniref:hypothetical protein n=1 Tax=Tessaracoccus sp. O5.2 TaxID=3157622 RepID=UPI0035ECE0DC